MSVSAGDQSGGAGEGSPKSLATTILLGRIRGGDEVAWDELMLRLLPKIEKWVRKERKSAALKEKYETVDLTQDVAMELIRYLPDVKLSDSSTLDRILYRMIQNTLRDTYDYLTRLRRRVSRERPIPGDTVLDLDPPHLQVETPSEAVGNREERALQEAWVRLALPLLEPEDQGLILRHKMFGESYIDIGASLDLTPDAVRMRCNRAITRLVKTVGLLRRGRLDAALGDDGEEEVGSEP